MGRGRHHLKGGYSSSWIRQTTRLAVYLRDGLCCVYCLQDWSVDGLTVDHIRARSAGGTNSHENLVSACARCNALKRACNDDLAQMAEALGVQERTLRARLSQQATPLTIHLRRRALHALKFPPPWLRELKRLNENWTPQQPLFPPEKRVLPLVIVEQPEDPGADDASPDNDDIPF